MAPHGVNRAPDCMGYVLSMHNVLSDAMPFHGGSERGKRRKGVSLLCLASRLVWRALTDPECVIVYKLYVR